MKCISRFQQYRNDDFDQILIKIRNGTIKSGRYAHHVKVDGDKKLIEGKLFADGKSSETK